MAARSPAPMPSPFRHVIHLEAQRTSKPRFKPRASFKRLGVAPTPIVAHEQPFAFCAEKDVARELEYYDAMYLHPMISGLSAPHDHEKRDQCAHAIAVLSRACTGCPGCTAAHMRQLRDAVPCLLAVNEENRDVLVRAGAVEAIVEQLYTATDYTRQQGCIALNYLLPVNLEILKELLQKGFMDCLMWLMQSTKSTHELKILVSGPSSAGGSVQSSHRCFQHACYC